MKPLFYGALLIALIILINDYVLKFRPFVRPFVRRGCDKDGCGYFGAKRTDHTHMGMDVKTYVGQPVYAPFSGTTRLFKPYAGYDPLDGIEISGKVYKVKLMYVAPIVGLGGGAKVKAGQLIGYAQSLADKYGDIQNHIHSEVWSGGVARNPTSFFPPDTPELLA